MLSQTGSCMRPDLLILVPVLRRKSRVRATVAAAVAEPGGGRQCWESPPSQQLCPGSWRWRWAAAPQQLVAPVLSTVAASRGLPRQQASEPDDTSCLLRKGRSGTQAYWTLHLILC